MITKEEARQLWGTNFAKVNAQAMFNEVDVDGNKLSRRPYVPTARAGARRGLSWFTATPGIVHGCHMADNSNV